jgi:hypothetical protein
MTPEKERARMRKVEVLIARATIPGERAAAEEALRRIKARLAQEQPDRAHDATGSAAKQSRDSNRQASARSHDATGSGAKQGRDANGHAGARPRDSKGRWTKGRHAKERASPRGRKAQDQRAGDYVEIEVEIGGYYSELLLRCLADRRGFQVASIRGTRAFVAKGPERLVQKALREFKALEYSLFLHLRFATSEFCHKSVRRK